MPPEDEYGDLTQPVDVYSWSWNFRIRRKTRLLFSMTQEEWEERECLKRYLSEELHRQFGDQADGIRETATCLFRNMYRQDRERQQLEKNREELKCTEIEDGERESCEDFLAGQWELYERVRARHKMEAEELQLTIDRATDAAESAREREALQAACQNPQGPPAMCCVAELVPGTEEMRLETERLGRELEHLLAAARQNGGPGPANTRTGLHHEISLNQRRLIRAARIWRYWQVFYSDATQRAHFTNEGRRRDRQFERERDGIVSLRSNACQPAHLAMLRLNEAGQAVTIGEAPQDILRRWSQDMIRVQASRAAHQLRIANMAGELDLGSGETDRLATAFSHAEDLLEIRRRNRVRERQRDELESLAAQDDGSGMFSDESDWTGDESGFAD